MHHDDSDPPLASIREESYLCFGLYAVRVVATVFCSRQESYFCLSAFNYTASTKVANVYREGLLNTGEGHFKKLCSVYHSHPAPKSKSSSLP